MMNHIVDGIFISSAACVIGSKSKQKLEEMNIKRVLTTSGMPIESANQIPDVDYKFIFMMDLFSQDILGNGILDDSLSYIENSVQDGVNVLVHCEAGVSRSVTIVAAYIMRRFEWNLDKAITFIQKARPVACPNISFLQQLSIFEKLNYRSDSKSLAYSTVYRTYCADSGTPVPIFDTSSTDNSTDKINSNVDEASSSLSSINLDSGKNLNGSKAVRHSHLLHSLNSDSSNETITLFRCRKCRMELFHDRHLMYHSRGFRRGHSTNIGKWDYAIKSPVKLTVGSDDEDNTFQSSQKDVDLKEEIKKEDKSSISTKTEGLTGNEQCQIEYLLTPIKWMDLEEYQGKINCPKCNEKLGQYCWSGMACSGDGFGLYKCGTFVSPWIHIQKCKVDIVKNVLPSNNAFPRIDSNTSESGKKSITNVPNAVVTLSN